MGFCHRLHWPDEFQQLAADRKKKGFNVIQIVAGLYPDMEPFDPRGANEAGFPWEKDYARLRPNTLMLSISVLGIWSSRVYLRRVMDDVLSETRPSLAEFQIVEPGIDKALKITKEIERYTQLEIKLKAAEQEAAQLEEARDAALNGVPLFE